MISRPISDRFRAQPSTPVVSFRRVISSYFRILLGRASVGGQRASVVLTLDVYSHLLGSMQRDAADRIDEILK
jgi:hypothetical protein